MYHVGSQDKELHSCVRTCIVSSDQIIKCSDFIQSVRLEVASQSCCVCLLHVYVYLKPHSQLCASLGSSVPQVLINLVSFVHSGIIKSGTRSSQNVKVRHKFEGGKQKDACHLSSDCLFQSCKIFCRVKLRQF